MEQPKDLHSFLPKQFLRWQEPRSANITTGLKAAAKQDAVGKQAHFENLPEVGRTEDPLFPQDTFTGTYLL